MPHSREEPPFDSEVLAQELRAFIASEAIRYGSTTAIKPPHRVKFAWPPHPVSYEYHVLASDWASKTSFEAHGETFEVEVAKTPFGVFGRAPIIWHEARGDDEESMLQELISSSKPLFDRQLTIARTLGKTGLYSGELRALPALDRMKLFYCEDRDVANSVHQIIETSKFRKAYFPALCEILNDRTHPWRRSAQWCVLDLFEDLPSFVSSENEGIVAVQAMKGLLWDAEDDYARAIYKAGVVLGGHIPHRHGGEALIECLSAPSRVGRRSAIHGLFHVCEWVPELASRVTTTLRSQGQNDPDPQLRVFAFAIADDIEVGGVDHTSEPVFAFEQ
jgi:hypothetical protein